MKKLKTIGLVAMVIAATGCFAPQAKADQVTAIQNEMNRATFAQSGDIFANRGIDRQFTLLFGLSFPEQESFNDAMSIHDVYLKGLKQRTITPIVTEDLPNPYTTSVLNEQRLKGN